MHSPLYGALAPLTMPRGTKAGSAIAADQVRVELTASDTDDLKPTGGEPYLFDVQAILPTNLRRLTLVRGACTVYEDATT